MDTITMIAKLMGWTFLAAGLGMIISGKHYRAMLRSLNKTSPVLLFLAGLVELPIGIAIVIATAGICWHLAIVTMIVGLLFIAEGFSLLVIPQYWLKFWTKFKICNYCLGGAMLLLACYFIIAT
ncbi:hypothetical protein AAEX28_14085 [Lentisphaerota bacterium WC36G]|nr:hypothetical protein LJT99_00835 [Lentisphaerae bacterium WC36]